MSAPGLRLFTALPVPQEAAERLAALQSGLSGARWSRRDNLHLTLRFIGQADTQACRAYREALAGVEFPALRYAIDGVDRWPNGVVLARVTDMPELTALKAEIDRRLATAGLPPETRPFRPHVTLARLRGSQPPEELTAWLTRLKEFRLAGIEAARFHLYESRSTAEGVRYLPLASYPAE